MQSLNTKHLIIAGLLATVTIFSTRAVWFAVQPTVLVEWPVSERTASGRLYVDDESVALPVDQNPITIEVTPGVHSVRLNRFGFEQVEIETNQLGWRDTETIIPEWTMTEEGTIREELDAIALEVETARGRPVFEQTKVKRQLNRLALAPQLREWPELAANLDALGTFLKSPLDRAVLTNDVSDRPPQNLLTLGSNRLRHVGSVSAVEISPSGHVIASAGMDGRLMFHDGKTGDTLFPIDRHKAGITAVRFVDEERLVSIDQSGLAVLTSLPQRRATELHQANGELTALAVLDERRIATAGAGGRVHVIDIQNRRVVQAVDAGSPVARLLSVSPTDLVAVSIDGLVTAFESLQERITIKGPPAKFVSFERNRNRLTVFGPDLASTWNFKNGKSVMDFKPQPGLINVAADRSWLAAVERDGRRFRVLVKIGEERHEIPIGSRVPVVATCHAESSRAVIGTRGGAVLLIDLNGDTVIASPAAPNETWQRVAFDRSSHELAATTADGSIHVFRTFDWQTSRTIEGDGRSVRQVLLSGVTGQIIAAYDSEIVMHADGDKQTLAGTLPVALTDDERYLVYCSAKDGGTQLCIHDLRNQRNELRRDTSFRITSLLPLPRQGSVVIGTADGLITALSWKTGKDRWRKQNKRQSGNGSQIHQIIRSESDEEVLYLDDDGLQSWSLRTGQASSIEDQPHPIGAIRFAGGQTFVSNRNRLGPLRVITRPDSGASLPIGPNARLPEFQLTADGLSFALCTGDGRLLVGLSCPPQK